MDNKLQKHFNNDNFGAEEIVMIEIPTFWFVTLILACLWLGGALALAALAYIGWVRTDAPLEVLESLRAWWEVDGLGSSKLTRFAITVFMWIFYPLLLILAWVGTVFDSAEENKKIAAARAAKNAP